MEKEKLPQWLRTWQSEFQTCLDVWTELKEEALAHQLSPEQKIEMECLIKKRFNLYRDTFQLLEDGKKKEFDLQYEEELFPLYTTLQEFSKKNGYYDLRTMKEGRVGMRSAKGETALPPDYEDICFTYDDDYLSTEFFNEDGNYVVKKDGKWGIVNRQQKILLPFEYDFIFRKPDSMHYYVLIKDGKQGLATLRTRRGEIIIDIVISVEMDAIHHVPGWDLTLLTKNGKWGWWWEDTFDFYKNYSDPEYDSIYVQPIEEVWEMPDDEDEIITVRKGDKFYDILYWTSK